MIPLIQPADAVVNVRPHEAPADLLGPGIGDQSSLPLAPGQGLLSNRGHGRDERDRDQECGHGRQQAGDDAILAAPPPGTVPPITRRDRLARSPAIEVRGQALAEG